MKRVIKFIARFLGVLLLLVLLAYVALQTSPVQTWLTNKIATSMEQELGVKVEIERVDVKFFTNVVLKGVNIKDRNNENLLTAEEFVIGGIELDRGNEQLILGNIELVSPDFYLYMQENDTVTNIQPIIDYINSSANSEDTASWRITLEHLYLQNGRFRYSNYNAPENSSNVIDWNHIKLDDLNIQIDEFWNVGDSISARIEDLSLVERSGFAIKKLSGDYLLASSEMILNSLDLKTANSKITGDLKFGFDSLRDFGSFNEEIYMEHTLKSSSLNIKDLSYFASDLNGIEEKLIIDGKVRGTVSDLKGRKLNLRFGEITTFQGSIDFLGLPNIDETFINVHIKELETKKSDLDQIPLPPFNKGDRLKTPDNFATLGRIRFKGDFTGFINDFVAYGKLGTAIGSIESDIKLQAIEDDFEYQGKISTNDFNLAIFYENKNLGKLNSSLEVDGHGLALEKLDAQVTGTIKSITLVDYLYEDIHMDGSFKDHYFNGDMRIRDDNLQMTFSGEVDLAGKDPIFNFVSQVDHLNLRALNLFEYKNYLSVSGGVSINAVGSNFQTAVGSLQAKDLIICTDYRDYEVSELTLNAANTEKGRRIDLSSGLATGYVEGKFDYPGLASGAEQVLADVIPAYETTIRRGKEDFTLDLTTGDLSVLFDLLDPNLYIAPGTHLLLSMSDIERSIKGNLYSDRIRYHDVYVDTMIVDIQKPGEEMYLNLISDRLSFRDSVEFSPISLDSRNEADTIYTSISWGEPSDDLTGEVNSKIQILSNDHITLSFYPSKFFIKQTEWLIDTTTKLEMDSTSYAVENLKLSHNDQFVFINGVVSENSEDILDIELHNIDLDLINPWIANSATRIIGLANGNASLRDVYDTPLIGSDLSINHLGINEYDIGDLSLLSNWDPKVRQLLMKGDLQYGQLKTIRFGGFYRPDNEDSPLDLVARLEHTDLAFINAFIDEGITDINGQISGNVNITGTFDHPELNGTARFENTSVFIDYLNTTYYLQEEAGIYPDMFTLDGIMITDALGNKASLVGTILHENFVNWNFDVYLEMLEEPFMAMNTKAVNNDLYYGSVVCTGYVNVSGYADQLYISVNVKSEKGSKLALPLGGSEEVAFEDFVTFVDHTVEQQKEKVDLSGISLDLELDITPDAEFRIIFDEAIGDEIKGSGQGHINMVISNLSTFNMFGQVEVVEGDYLFTLKNLINKEFEVVPGGTIAWFGDPLDADVNLDATYKLSAPLYDLMTEDSDKYKQRVPVNLVMDLSGKLMNPNINFNILLPTVDEITRARVNSAISTKEETNRQAFALLVLRRFISPPNISKTHSSGAIAENSTEFLSAQVSNWLSQISNDFDIGVNYRPGDEITNEELAVALSTQLFNNRLLVSGSFGVTGDSSTNADTQNANNLVGDIRVEYKVQPDGHIRVIVYNQSNDYDLANTQQVPYTQGLGMIFQREFENIYEMFNIQKPTN